MTGVLAMGVCAECGTPFEVKSPKHVFCKRSCRDRKRERERDDSPARVIAARARNRAWAAEHRNTTQRQPWLTGQPPHGPHLRGAGFELDILPHPKWPVVHRNIRALHGLVTDLLGVGHDAGGTGTQRAPMFSLVPWPRGVGWAVYCTRSEDAARVAGKALDGRHLYDVPVTARCGPLMRPRSPEVTKRGRRRVKIDAITPVCTRNTGGRFYHTDPSAEHIRNAITRHLAPRLDGHVDDADVCVEIVSSDTRAESVEIGSKWGSVTGWVGSVIVECNAVAHWMLLAAAQGPGLGGRTGQGFGRVRVSDG